MAAYYDMFFVPEDQDDFDYDYESVNCKIKLNI